MKMIAKGMKVYVFSDPITRMKLEGEGKVTKVHRQEGWSDRGGNQMYLCNIRFEGDPRVYPRNVSIAVEEE
jgi:hypothetical protein